jgi:hypothetical protein
MALQKIGVAVDAAIPPIERAAELWWSYVTADGGQPLNEAMGDRIGLSRERLRRFLFSRSQASPLQNSSESRFSATSIG